MSSFTFTLNQQEYEALLGFARAGTLTAEGQVDQDKALHLEQFLRAVEKRNGIARDIVWLQWQEAGAPLPPGTNFPSTWPPEMRARVEMVTRKVAKADLDAVLTEQAKLPMNVLFTRDAAAMVGWTEYAKYA